MIQLLIKHFVSAVVAIFVLSTSAWALDLQPKKQEPIIIGISDKQGTAVGFSFMPPDEDGWIMTKNGLSVSLKKQGKSEVENSQIDAYLIILDTPVIPISDYVERIKQNIQKGYAQDNRFKIVSFDVTEDKSNSQCVRLHLLLEVLKPVSIVTHEPKKFIEQYDLSCGLLKNKRVGFEVRYYNRYYEPNKDSQLVEKASNIFSTVKIIDDK